MKKIVLMAVVLVGICAFAVYMKKKLEKKQSVALAAYSYPSDDSNYWKEVIKEGGKNIPYVIINPNSGPGDKIDSNYVKQLKENMKAGIKNIAYIRTNYQKRPLAEVLAVVTYDEIEFYVENPVQTLEEAKNLAVEHYIFCYDIVAQCYGTFEKLVDALYKNIQWYFWWD